MFNFGENLKTLRISKGLTQEQVAGLLDISKQSISRWENNITYPDITFLPILASFYCVTIDFLLGADYETNKVTLEDYDTRRKEAHMMGDFASAYELSQKLYTMFPNEQSVTWMRKLPSIWSGIESAALEVFDGQDKIDSIQCTLDAVLHLMYHLISTYASEQDLSKVGQIKILEKIPHIFEIFYENGDFGFYHVFLSRVYVELAKLFATGSEEFESYKKMHWNMHTILTI